MKKLTAVLAALLVLACGTTVLAAPSVTAADLAEGVTATSTVEVTLAEVEEAVVEAALETAEAKNENSKVLALVDVSVPEGTGSVTITFAVEGVKAGDNIYLLHQKADKTWEVIHPDKVEDGKVTATFTSLSPVAIVSVPAEETLPQTGASLVLPVAALICAAGTVGCARKVKFN